jgi:pyrroline-5-carboxylate reductase
MIKGKLKTRTFLLQCKNKKTQKLEQIMLKEKKITIIGTGNLGSSIVRGLIKNNIPAKNITATDKSIDRIDHFAKLGVNISTDNKSAIRGADIVILAVKPFTAREILSDLAPALSSGQLFISVVSKFSIKQIRETIDNDDVTVCRVMPNTAIAINESMTCIAAPNATETQKAALTELFSGLGTSIFINEDMMDAATVLAACGIAFAMRFIRAMMQGGIEIGFDSKTAKLIVNQTVKGAAELLIQNQLHPEEEIDKVTTPKGYTITGLNEMEHNGFSSSLIKGILTSFNKIEP